MSEKKQTLELTWIGKENWPRYLKRSISEDKTRFNGLFTDQVLAEDGIANKRGRPITWQYQG